LKENVGAALGLDKYNKFYEYLHNARLKNKKMKKE